MGGQYHHMEKYGSTSEYKQSHFDQGFQEPIFAFVPSIGISEIIKVPNDFNKNWQNNFLVASLNKNVCLELNSIKIIRN